MKSYPLSDNIHLGALISEVQSVSLDVIPDGSGSSHYGGPEHWIYGLRMARIDVTEYPWLNAAVRELMGDKLPVQVMVNELAAGGVLEPHRDGAPDYLRFHLPIVTGEGVHWWDENNGRVIMQPGVWHGPVPYCGVLHAMVNHSAVDRIHVVADFERE